MASSSTSARCQREGGAVISEALVACHQSATTAYETARRNVLDSVNETSACRDGQATERISRYPEAPEAALISMALTATRCRFESRLRRLMRAA
jgi:hypothetical protein